MKVIEIKKIEAPLKTLAKELEIRRQMNGLVGEIIPHLLKNINEIKSNG